MRLGIDFGTTRTVVAAVEAGRYPVLSFDLDGELRDWLPGLVARGPEGELLLGHEAARAGAEGAPLVRSIKRLLSEPDPAAAEALGASPEELISAFLTYLRRMLREKSNLRELARDEGEPLEAMVAVPAQAHSRQRFATLEAFGRAGFRVLGMLNEPTAAAIELAHRQLTLLSARSPKRYVVVYDLGGGTFDVAAVSLEGSRFSLLASEGIGRLGGDDFDAILLEEALAAAGVEAPPPSLETPLLELCREAKEGLGPRHKKALIDLSALLSAEPVVLDLEAVYARCEPKIEATLAKLEEIFAALPRFGIDPENARELGAIYVVGGGASFPPVLKALRERHRRKIQLAPMPHAATAIGLAVAADPEAALQVREAITRHFGVWREAAGGREKVFDPIFTKGEAPPEGEAATVSRSYRPTHTVGHLRYLECTSLGEGGIPSGEITPWQELLFPYDPSLAGEEELSSIAIRCSAELASEEIVEIYRYLQDGRISVRVENRRRGYGREALLGRLL